MPYFDQAQFDLRCEWGLPGVTNLATADVIVIVDVLSFTTAVEVAVSRGATVLPYRWRDETAVEYARQHDAMLAGPRDGAAGGDALSPSSLVANSRDKTAGGYSLAPSSLINAPPGLRLVLPSPNGSTLAFAAMTSGAIVVAGCLRNARAVAAFPAPHGKKINVIPAGERWPDGSLRPAVEDLLAAGAILKSLPGTRSPEAQAAVAAFEDAVGEFENVAGNLRGKLLACASGRELIERGFGQDVDIAAQVDVSQVVPILKGDAFIAAREA